MILCKIREIYDDAPDGVACKYSHKLSSAPVITELNPPQNLHGSYEEDFLPLKSMALHYPIDGGLLRVNTSIKEFWIWKKPKNSIRLRYDLYAYIYQLTSFSYHIRVCTHTIVSCFVS